MKIVITSWNSLVCGLVLVAGLWSGGGVNAATLTSGQATMTLDEGKASSIGFFDAYFGDANTRAELLALPAPGTVPFDRLSGTPGTVGTAQVPGSLGTPGTVSVVDAMRPYGEVVPPGTPGSSRTKQATTLDFDPSNLLGSWTAANDAFAFVGNTSVGEQVAFTGMQRWGGPFTGVLVYGDFALRYVPSRAVGANSGLVLTSNLDFPHAVFANLANVAIEIDPVAETLSITGDMLIGEGLWVLDPSAVIGTKIGTFDFVGSFAPVVVPEPTTIAMLLTGLAFSCVAFRKRSGQRTS